LERNDLLKNFMSNNKVLSINDLGYNYWKNRKVFN
jgi:hypothetical protein